MKLLTPNAIIVRVPDQDGSKTFLQIPMDSQGLAVPVNAEEFRVFDGDNYNLLEFNQIIIAHTADDGNSSIEICRVSVQAKNGSPEPIVVYTDLVEVALMAKDLFDQIQSGNIYDDEPAQP